MAPDRLNYNLLTITQLRYQNACYVANPTTFKKTETKKEKQSRLATEKMYASHKTHNNKTKTVIEIKRVCNPKHRINHVFGRF